LGPDRRRESREVLYERRQAVREGTAKLVGGIALAVFLTLLSLSAFALWYLVKCLVGADIVPGFSLSQYLRRMLYTLFDNQLYPVILLEFAQIRLNTPLTS
jgi:hypothetical protein